MLDVALQQPPAFGQSAEQMSAWTHTDPMTQKRRAPPTNAFTAQRWILALFAADIRLITLPCSCRDVVADDTRPGVAAPNEPEVVAPAENGR